MAKNIRNLQGQDVVDPSLLENLEYNNAAGSKKVSEVGRNLIPIAYLSGSSIAYTTDASTAKRLDFPGKNLAIYNSTGTLGSVTLGADPGPPIVLASGVTDSNGNVGIPCMPNAWTYIACDNKNWVITSASTLMVFQINDSTAIKKEAAY